MLNRRRTNQSVTKLEGMTQAITSQAFASELACGDVCGQGIQPGEKGRDCFLFAAPNPSTDLGPANGRVTKGLASRCLCGNPTARLRVATQDLNQYVRIQNHRANRSMR
jgi:hypothetical protein